MNTLKHDSRPVSVGTKLGPYQVTFELARGGMATVYLARTEGRAGLHRYVALKCIRHELARDPGFIDMFFDEARIASQIHHPNVCSVLDFDRQGDVYYLAMELLSGHTLTKVLQKLQERPNLQGPLYQAGLVCRVLADACEGLHAAHELCGPKGEPLEIVHRDVAPDNLFITWDGGVKVLDFGVAIATEQRHHTQTGMIRGKCSYLSPEVLKGKKPDRRADIWGIGVTAWEMLTHKKLFKGDSDLEIFRGICGHNIPAPSSVCPGLPPALDAVVLKALERKPEARYASARELGRALVGVLLENKLAIGPAEIADTLAELFPGGRNDTRQLFELAEQVTPQQSTQALPAAEISARHVQLVAETQKPAQQPVQQPPPLPPQRPAVPARRLDLPLAVALCSLVVALAALVGTLVLRPSAAAEAPRVEARGPQPVPTARPPGVSEPYGIEVTRLPMDTSGEVVLRLKLTGR